MKTLQKLITRLNDELNLEIPLNSTIKHLKPSPNQEMRGMFKWVFEGRFNRYGSSQGIRELVKSKRLHISYTTIGGISVVALSLYEILGFEE